MPTVFLSILKNFTATRINSYYSIGSTKTFYFLSSFYIPGSHVINYYRQTGTNHHTTHKARILCMIFTTPEKWNTRARAIRNTWGQRCYKAVYFYSKGPKELRNDGVQTQALNVTEGRGYLTDKTRAALKWSVEHFRHEVDWYLKADDDVYILMENLETYVANFNTTSPHYIGKSNSPRTHKQEYASGGAGYVLNLEAAEILLKGPELKPILCTASGSLEDLDIGACLRAFGVRLHDTADKNGRQRLHCNDPIKVLQNPQMAPFYYIVKGDYEFGSRHVSHLSFYYYYYHV